MFTDIADLSLKILKVQHNLFCITLAHKFYDDI